MRLLLLATLLFAQDDIAELIRKLGSSSLEERDAASAELIKRGPAAIEALEAAARSADTDIASRAKDVLAAIARRPDSLKRVLVALGAKHKDDPDALLTAARDAVQASLVDKPWPEVAAAFEQQKLACTLRPGRAIGTLATYEVPLPRSDVPVSILVDCAIFRKLSKTEPTRHVIGSVAARLVAIPNAPFDDVVQAAPFPKGSWFALALANDEVRKAAATQPILKSIELEHCEAIDFNSGKAHPRLTVAVDLESKDGSGGVRFSGAATEEGTLPLERRSLWQYSDRGPNRTYWTLRRTGLAAYKPEPDPPVAYSRPDLKALPDDTERLTLWGEFLEAGDLVELARFKKLRELDFATTHLPASTLVGLDALERLTLSEIAVDEAALAPLLKLSKLRHLTIYGHSKFAEDAVNTIAQIRTLEHLELWYCGTLTDKGLAQLATLKGLRELRLWGSDKITDAGLREIAKLAELRELTFSCPVTKAGLAALRALKKLETLNIGPAAVDDAGAAEIAGIGSLHHLTLHGVDITNDGLVLFRSLEKLDQLSINECAKITEDGIKKLQAAMKGTFELK